MTPATGACLEALLEAALRAADPGPPTAAALPEPPRGRTFVVAAGKAAGRMAEAVERAFPGPLEGLAVVPHGQRVSLGRLCVLEASHPVPDAASESAARACLALASRAGPNDLVLCLLSGGASALLAMPREGVTLAEKQVVTRALLASGASIAEINCVRRRLSAIKGGGIARAAAPARLVTLAVSDVVGDNPAVIGSGPTVADPATPATALAVLDRYRIETSEAVRRCLAAEAGAAPPPGEYRIVLRPRDMLDAAASAARARGLGVLDLGDGVEGEAREVARAMAGIARSIRREGRPVEPPAVVLSGGELTVTVRGPGRGGRNSEFALALALALDGEPGVRGLAVDTDGIDGTGPFAGGRFDPVTLERARGAGVDPVQALARNDAATCLEAAGDLLVTGPTGTNLNDFRAVLVDRTASP